MAELALEDLMERFAGLVLLHGLWIGLLVAGVAAILLRFVPARWRESQHALLLAGLLIVGIGPFVAVALQGQVAQTSGSVAQVEISEGTSTPQVNAAKAVSEPKQVAMQPVASPATQSWMPGLKAAESLWLEFEPVIVAVWLLMTCVMFLRVALGFVLASFQRCRAHSAPPAVQARCAELARRIGLKRPIRSFISSRLDEPCLSGIWRPVVLLPAAWLDAATPRQLDAVLAHELAHARRGDSRVILIQRLVEALWGLHPGVRWLSRMLDHRRERCADAMAVKLIGDPIALAETLESLTRLRMKSRGWRMMPLGASLGARDETSLLHRIEEILGMRPSQVRLHWWALGAIVGAGLLGVFVLSLGPDRSSYREAPKGVLVASGQGAVRKVAADGPADPHRQIEFEVVWITCPPGIWHSAMDGHRRSVEGVPEGEAWVIDHRNLLARAVQADSRSNFVQAPRTVMHEGESSFLDCSRTDRYIVDLELKQSPSGTASFEPKFRDVKTGFEVRLEGNIVDGGVHLKGDVTGSDLQSIETLKRRTESGGKPLEALYYLPTVASHNRRVDCTLTEDSSLLVSLGCRTRKESVSLSTFDRVVELLSGHLTQEEVTWTEEVLVLIRPKARVLTDAQLLAIQKKSVSRSQQ